MRTALIVEDDADIREVMRDALQEEGIPVAVARHGVEALEAIRSRGRPGVVLLDLMMPVMNGWQFLETLDVDIPIIVVSAYVHGAKTMATAVLLRRPVGFMTKPIDLDLLLEVVRQYCAEPASAQEAADAR